jgi:periplasmic divalent cation tolerance protein
MSTQVIVAFSTVPDEATGQRIAKCLVTEGLAACVNRLPNVRSSYIWEGRLQDDAEILLIIKTTAERLAAMRQRLIELHPYDLPELVAIGVVGGNEPYMEWIRQGVRPGNPKQ